MRRKIMKEVIIREALPEDAEKLIDYLNKIGGESNHLLHGANGCQITVEKEREFITRIKNAKNECMLVGVCDGEIVSVASLSGYAKKRVAHRGSLGVSAHRGSLGVSVRKSYWNQGIGTKMIERLIAFAKSASICVIELEVKEDNENAIALYEKMGFEKIGRYKKYFCIEGTYYDAYLMNLYLD